MPHPTWKHRCCAVARERKAITGRRDCFNCGELGEFAGWGLSMVEAMGRFQRVTGMKAMGPGRLKIDVTIRTCGTCGGSGYAGTQYRKEKCNDCDGEGQWLDCDAETKEWIRKRSEEEVRRHGRQGKRKRGRETGDDR